VNRGVIDLTLPSLTQGSTPDLKFNYFVDSNLIEFATKIDSITASGKYYVKAINAAGCLDVRQIVVQYDTVPDISVTDPPPASYPQTVNITAPDLITGSTPGMTYTYWKDPAATIPLTTPNALAYAGKFYIKATTKFGCSVVEPIEVSLAIGQPPNVFSPNNDGINDFRMNKQFNEPISCSNFLNNWKEIYFLIRPCAPYMPPMLLLTAKCRWQWQYQSQKRSS
jgi:hypothetical protein